MTAATDTPWVTAEEWSIWSASGRYDGEQGTFRDCLIISLPHFATGGEVVFQMLPPLSDVLTAANIESAVEFKLVRVHAAAVCDCPPASVIGDGPSVDCPVHGEGAPGAGDQVFLEKFSIGHAHFGGLGGDVARVVITREAWEQMGRAQVLTASAVPFDGGEES